MEKEEEEEVGVNATAIVGVRVTIGREAEVIAGVAVWRVLIPVSAGLLRDNNNRLAMVPKHPLLSRWGRIGYPPIIAIMLHNTNNNDPPLFRFRHRM